MARRPQPTGLPTRQQILDFIEGSETPAGKREIAKAFGLSGHDKIALKQLLRDMDQRSVAASMTEAIIEHLEPVEIDEQHRGGGVVTLMARDHDFELAEHSAAIEYRHQRVEVGEPVELAHLILKPRDVALQLRDLFEQLGRIAAYLANIVHDESPLSRDQ